LKGPSGPFLFYAAMPAPMIVCKHCFVSGRVQGVFYRASAGERARALKLTGYAKNLPDGRVEVRGFAGTGGRGSAMRLAVAGPPAAKVSEVVVRTVECTEIPREFTVR